MHVTGRQPETGYHLLDSLVAFAEIGDDLSVTESGVLSLTIDGPFAGELPSGDGNLVVKAAHELASAYGVAAAADIHLTKQLPVASGIGGGSADAAAALLALSQLWQLPRDDARLHRVAVRLGADVRMCLDTHPCFVAGIGDETRRAPRLPPLWCVLANAGVPVLTADVYRKRAGPFTQSAKLDLDTFVDAGSFAGTLALCRNDLTEAALQVAPAIADVMDALIALPGASVVRMSGSGGTCFALFAERADAEAGAETLADRFPAWWVNASPLVRGQHGQSG